MKNINTKTAAISASNILRFLFWSLIVGMTFYFIVGHFIKYTTKGIPENFGTTLMNKQIWFFLHIAGGSIAIILEAYGIKYYAEEYIGRHENKLGGWDGRIYSEMLPFFDTYLKFGEAR